MVELFKQKISRFLGDQFMDAGDKEHLSVAPTISPQIAHPCLKSEEITLLQTIDKERCVVKLRHLPHVVHFESNKPCSETPYLYKSSGEQHLNNFF